MENRRRENCPRAWVEEMADQRKGGLGDERRGEREGTRVRGSGIGLGGESGEYLRQGSEIMDGPVELPDPDFI